MRPRTFGVVALLAWFGGVATAQDARSVMDAAARALGAAGVRSIQYSGGG